MVGLRLGANGGFLRGAGGGFLSTEPVGAGAGDLSGTFYLESNAVGTQTDMPFEIMIPIKGGNLTSGQRIVAKDGVTTLNIQEDNASTDQDSDVRLVKITGILPTINASQRKTITLTAESGSPASGTAISIANILATDYEVTAKCTISATLYSALATDAINAGTTWSLIGDRYDGTFRSGPYCTEYVCSAVLQASGPTYHSHLRAVFHIAAYKKNSGAVDGGNPITAIRTDVIIENGFFDVLSPADITYDYAIDVFDGGTTTPVSDAGRVHWYAQRLKERVWWGTEHEYFQMHDWDYLRASEAIPNHIWEQADLTLPLNTDDLDNGDNVTRYDGTYRNIWPGMGAAANREDIALMHESQVKGFIAESEEGHRWITEQGDACGWIVNHYREDADGKLLDPGAYSDTTSTWPTFSSSGNGDLIEWPSSSEDWGLDMAHYPSVFFAPYILTGDLFYLEEAAFTAQWSLAHRDAALNLWNLGPSTGHARVYFCEDNGQWNGQPRGVAWCVRNLAQAVFCIPDSLNGTVLGTTKTIMQASLDAQVDYRKTTTIDLTSASETYGAGDRYTPLGMHAIGPSGTSKPYDWGGPTNWFPWQNNYINCALHHARELNVLSANGIAVQEWFLDGYDNLLSLSGWGVAKDRICTAYRVPFYSDEAGRQNIPSSVTSAVLDIDMKFENMWKWANRSTYSQGAPSGSKGPAQFLEDVTVDVDALDGVAVNVTFGGVGLEGTLAHYVDTYLFTSTVGGSTTPRAIVVSVSDANNAIVDTTYTHPIETDYNGRTFDDLNNAAGVIRYARPESSFGTEASIGNSEADKQYVALTQMAGLLCKQYSRTNGVTSKAYGDNLYDNFTSIGYEKFNFAERT